MNDSSDDPDVTESLDLVLESLADERRRLNGEGAKAMQAGKYETATAVIQFAQRLLEFQGEVDGLISKWKKLESSRDAATPQVRQILGSRMGDLNRFEKTPRVRRVVKGALSGTVLHCFHILDVLIERGGRATNQNVSTAVNKRIKMLYPKFKQARHMLAQEGWTEHIASSQALEISNRGISWLRAQKSQIEESTRSDRDIVREKPIAAPAPLVDDDSGPFI